MSEKINTNHHFFGMGGKNMKKHILDFVLISAAALFLMFTLGYYFGKHSVRGLTVETEPAATLPPIFESGDDFDYGLKENSIDLNTASEAQLESLPGIGPTLAERIVAYREETGGFSSVEEILEVYGIGSKTFEEISPYLTVTR